MADTKEQEPKVVGAADPGATPRGEEPKVVPDPAAPPKGKEPKPKKPKKGPGGEARPAEPEGPPPEPAPPPRLYEFLDRFISIAVPRMRDFRGLPTDSFDGRGNYSIGIKEQMIFPEIDYDKVEKIHGMDITLVTTAGRDDTALALLRELGMPFRGEAPVAVA